MSLPKLTGTRAFISIEFPSEAIKEVARVQELIKNIKFTGKITEQENLHLTLKFLGNVDDDKLNQVKERLSKIKCFRSQKKKNDYGN